MKFRTINRNRDLLKINKLIKQFPITAILGARQVGKTTLAKQVRSNHYFDLEKPRDFTRLDNAQFTLENLSGLIVIDEIQRKPDLFPLLRFLVDENPKQKYLILGSASPALQKQSGESLAGRIGYHFLQGFRIEDIEHKLTQRLWLRGGFPASFLATNDEASSTWRENFISTFVARDLAEIGIRIPIETMRRFWIMLSHYHGQVINYSELSLSFGVNDKTIKNYMHILESAFVITLLHPWHTNTKKRLVKHPKLYINDSGLFHTLQSISNWNNLNTHAKVGASWEGFMLQQVRMKLGIATDKLFFYSTHTGTEVDLFWQAKGKNWAVEFKFNDNPKPTKSMYQSIKDLNLEKLFVIAPIKNSYDLSKKIKIMSPNELDFLL